MARPKKKQAGSLPPAMTSVCDWLARQALQDMLRFVVCGSVGDGKSTLVHRLLRESAQGLHNEWIAPSVGSRHPLEDVGGLDAASYADEGLAGREHDVIFDIAYHFFSTNRRKFIAADIPGHENNIRDMVSGATSADVAVLLIDVSRDASTHTRQHAYLASLAGIKQVVLAINKMDLVNYDQRAFESIVTGFSTFAGSIGLQLVAVIPLSAAKGDNITSGSARMAWYKGLSLLNCLESITIQKIQNQKAAFPVQSLSQIGSSFRVLMGTLATGKLATGDKIRVTASGRTATITSILTADGELATADAGHAVTLVLDTEVDACRGDVIALSDHPLEMTDQFESTLVWMHEEPGLVGRAFELKLGHQWANASITSLKYRIDVDTHAHESCRRLRLNDIAVANLALSKPLVFETYADSPALGGFILIDKFTQATVAVGMIRHNLRRAQNVHRQALSICREDRERLNGHKGKVVWFTGLSGSGKSTIANAIEKELHAQGKRTYILDGDNIRQGLNKDLGFTDGDRVENIRRVAEVAKLMMDAGMIVMTAFISPFRAERQMARELIGDDNFIEVFVDTPLEICEQRDPKGLYKKARNGEIPNMTGINSPYERPDRPDIVVSSGDMEANAAVKSLSALLQS